VRAYVGTAQTGETRRSECNSNKKQSRIQLQGRPAGGPPFHRRVRSRARDSITELAFGHFDAAVGDFSLDVIPVRLLLSHTFVVCTHARVH